MRRVVGLDTAVLQRAPEHVRTCLTWQLEPVALAARRSSPEDPTAEKSAWLATTGSEWGACGQAVVVDDEVVGCVVYAPAAYLPGVAAYPTAPVSPDALVMASLLVDPAYGGRGLGRILVQAMARDLLTRYGAGGPVRAVETIATTRSGGCAPPAGFCTAVGFSERRAHPRHPRMRLDLRATVSWRGELEQALERLRAGVRVPAPHRTSRATLTSRTTKPRDERSRGSRGVVDQAM